MTVIIRSEWKNLRICLFFSASLIMIWFEVRILVQVFQPQALHPLIFFLFKSRREKAAAAPLFLWFQESHQIRRTEEKERKGHGTGSAWEHEKADAAAAKT
jgi:hypothetical protein